MQKKLVLKTEIKSGKTISCQGRFWQCWQTCSWLWGLRGGCCFQGCKVRAQQARRTGWNLPFRPTCILSWGWPDRVPGLGLAAAAAAATFVATVGAAAAAAAAAAASTIGATCVVGKSCASAIVGNMNCKLTKWVSDPESVLHEIWPPRTPCRPSIRTVTPTTPSRTRVRGDGSDGGPPRAGAMAAALPALQFPEPNERRCKMQENSEENKHKNGQNRSSENAPREGGH